ncbi:MAG TPA: hypothetical protein VKB76_18705, partial [Ktedonobacterales bacterium]|nr:hypothetical protein [Ktedonobacterales bacterium]
VTNEHPGTTTSSTTIGSNSWTTISGTGTLAGTASTFTLYGVDHSSTTYIIVTVAPTSTSSSETTNFFKPMIQTFTFLK